jgi:hypothetical protein
MSRMDPGQQRNRGAALWGNLSSPAAGWRPQIGARLFGVLDDGFRGKRRDVVIRPGSLASS